MVTLPSAAAALYRRGIAANRGQFALQTLQVFYVGLMIGMQRVVLPDLAREFGVAQGAFLFLASFVASFGLVKGALNFVAGGLGDRFGRKPVLVTGWIVAIPIPFLIYAAPSWWWIVVANVFLGVNQGLTWSMTVNSQIDLAANDQRGLAVGINEATGYVAVGAAGFVAALLANAMGVRLALLVSGLVVIAAALAILPLVHETLSWAKAEQAEAGANHDRDPGGLPDSAASLGAIFARYSFRDRAGRAICQGGVVNKIADTLVWVMFPLFFKEHGVGLVEIGWLTGTYAAVWGLSQFWTGHLADRIGRRDPVIAGFFVLASGIALTAVGDSVSVWLPAAIVMGIGMALLYPNLIAAMSDRAAPLVRGRAIGVYRYWRDTGYAIGALFLGVVAQFAQAALPALWITALLTAGSGIWLWRALPRGDTPKVGTAVKQSF